MISRAAFLAALLSGALAAQSTLTPRADSTNYPAHGRLDRLEIGADYLVHSFSGGRETFIANDYLVVEVAIFPDKGQTVPLSANQFVLRLNGRKQALQPESPEIVAYSIQYPDYEHPSGLHPEASVGPVIFGAPQPQSRFPGDPTTIPPVVRQPEQDPSGVQKEPRVRPEELVVQAALPEGEHHAPVSGYLYFLYKGKTKSIRSLALEFTGSTGTISLPLL